MTFRNIAVAAALASVANIATAQTTGHVDGSIGGNTLDLSVSCFWGGEDTLEIKSHDFMMLSESFEPRPALHASFYNNNFFLVILTGDKAYKMAGRDPEGGLKPKESFDYSGTVQQQSGHDGPYDFDLTLDCPK